MNMKTFFLLLSLTILLFGCTKGQQYQNVDAKTFSTLIKNNEGIVLDVRTSQEYSRGHIEGSTLISTSDQKFVDKVKLLQKDKPLYIYCLTGSRSRSVANYLSKNGYSIIYNLQRGIIEWNQLGYPIVQSDVIAASSNKAYSNTEFQQLISGKLVLVDFHAPWCAPCKKLSPTIEKVKADYTGKANVEKVDIEVNKSLQTAYNVQSIPGLILFKSGKEVWRHIGVLTYEELSKILNQYL
ncbi:MAG: thioredoxin [Salinivirgaceae bacterium]|jgi:thioredoxin 1|nr:thioredoxin [Salinivirgaceae bacterium]